MRYLILLLYSSPFHVLPFFLPAVKIEHDLTDDYILRKKNEICLAKSFFPKLAVEPDNSKNTFLTEAIVIFTALGVCGLCPHSESSHSAVAM